MYLDSNELEVKDSTDSQKSASYLEIDNGVGLIAKLYENVMTSSFPIVNFPFHQYQYSSIMEFTFHKSNVILDCTQNNDFLCRAQLPTHKSYSNKY